MNKEQQYMKDPDIIIDKQDKLISELEDKVSLLEKIKTMYKDDEKRMKREIYNLKSTVQVLNDLRDLDKQIKQSDEKAINHLEEIVEIQEKINYSRKQFVIGLSIYSTFITIMLILAVVVA